MATVRAHAAASLEFVVPLAFAVAYIKVAFGNLGTALAGALVLLVTIAAFVSNLEGIGGRTVAGQVALYEPSDDVAAFIGTGLIITVAGNVTISTACFAAAMIIIHINISINHFS